MKLIIDIPEKMYHMINAGFYDYGDMNIIIQNGIRLDKIRAEIECLKHKNTDCSGYRWWNNAIDNCLCEIDKYKPESEDQE